jgi:hypothetical protein
MTVVKFDTREVDRSANKPPAEIPSIGLHRCKVVECEFKKEKGKEPQLVVVYAIDEPGRKSNGYRMWSYINWTLDSVAWKKDQFLAAMGLKQTGQFDTNKMVGKSVTVRVKHEEWNKELRAKSNGVWLAEDLDGDEYDVEPEDDEPEEDDEEELEEDEDEDEDVDDEEVDDEEDELEEDEEPEPEPVKRTTKKAAAPVKAAAKQTAAQKRAAAAVEETADLYDDEDEYPIAKLRQDCKDRDLSVKGPRSALVARLRANDLDPFGD